MNVPLNLPFGDSQLRFDYDGQTDGNPKFHGIAASGVAESDRAWTIYQYTYDASRQALTRTVAFKASWTNRASETYQ